MRVWLNSPAQFADSAEPDAARRGKNANCSRFATGQPGRFKAGGRFCGIDRTVPKDVNYSYEGIWVLDSLDSIYGRLVV